MLGEAVPTGEFAYLGHSRSLAFVRSTLRTRIGQYGLTELDAATIRLSTPRRFTQEISRLIYEAAAESSRRFSGIRYGSRLGDEFDNWAIFETADASIDIVGTQAVVSDDPDLLAALDLLGVQLV